ncbi:WhiB family transcriptional regulator [Prauserella endophytica]|uniref:Transcriptional regulator WhiB n=1 Tax=Prauserella endophytica TaxID=1592324 RepID=A0ABY2RW67_9PSEU|nr:WhiB family transcriptional regulator [Prauserella endophytica]TKG61568.1 WhiB family transcriptional regulator [Prauserella endophytica]
MTWRNQAACRNEDPELFYPLPASDASESHAKSICQTCPVSNNCLIEALTSGAPDGIWGGLNDAERRNLKRRQTGTAA